MIICPITASLTLTPNTIAPAYASVSADYSMLIIDASKIVLCDDIGVHAFTLTVKSPNFPSSTYLEVVVT